MKKASKGIDFDHRTRFRGMVTEVREELARKGVRISLSAVSQRLKSGNNAETMKIYTRKLKNWNKGMQEREKRMTTVQRLMNQNETEDNN